MPLALLQGLKKIEAPGHGLTSQGPLESKSKYGNKVWGPEKETSDKKTLKKECISYTCWPRAVVKKLGPLMLLHPTPAIALLRSTCPFQY